jgi:hypothetical protein
MHKRSFQLKIMGLIALVNLLFYIEVAIYGNSRVSVVKTTVNTTVTTFICNLESLPFYQYFYIFYLIEGFLAPFLLMFTSSLMIIRGLYKTRKRIEAHENRENKSRRAKDTKFAISSICLDFLFIVLTTPLMLTYIINISSNRILFAFFSVSSALMINLNFSKSFFVYLVSNSIFRKELIGLVKSINPNHVSVQSNTANSNNTHSKKITVK